LVKATLGGAGATQDRGVILVAGGGGVLRDAAQAPGSDNWYLNMNKLLNRIKT
jgi:hypothetical protein